jgi:predicted metal-dependent phosphoesterase TrpH
VRCAVHVHSNWSDDGHWRLDELAHAFSKRGYRAVMLAEHDRGWDAARWESYREACARASTPECLLVPGIEYGDADNTVHIAVWGDDTPFLGAGRPTLEILRAARSAGAVSVLAHPARRNAMDLLTPEWVALLTAVEVWNRKYDGWAPSRAGLGIARENPQLRVFAGNDFHTRRQFFPFALEIDAPDAVSTGLVFKALVAGRYTTTAFGRDVSAFCTGAGFHVAEMLEGARIRVAVPLRALRRRRSPATLH